MRSVGFLLFAIASAPSAVLSATTASLLKAGQHVIWSYAGLTPPQSLYDAISAGHVAGVIFFGDNVDSNISNVVASLKAANAKSPTQLPLLLMTDQEGGQVRRLPGEPVQSAKQMCASGTAASGGTGAGQNLKSVGMNVNLAPVLDVYRTAGDFEDQYQRSFSNDPAKVSSCGSAFITAQQATGVAATAKHFPGLGAAASNQNTDSVPVTLNVSAADLQNIDEMPYVAAIAAGLKLVMPSWAVYPSIDASRPSGLSSTFIFSELRGRLGFAGVTISDAIEAGALQAYGSDANRAILASEAGMDLILAAARDASQGDGIVTALANALDNGTLDSKMFDRATTRIASLRQSLS
ncbi:putative glycosyl hydrolase family 3 N terminal domain [Lyophyllum shimeji]|uniref:Glycosyl hydrolase family 3 N terminal domain n=1 Tax=Lyophyllum shimeji TaxID=47721 RepID=A0A9P3PTJ8_LYOSH|nr:putative glycosyl hydrolase family 3 N terminal domain [Lyophyllum shimeji]